MIDQDLIFGYCLQIKKATGKNEKVAILKDWHDYNKDYYSIFWNLMFSNKIKLGIDKKTVDSNKSTNLQFDLEEQGIMELLDYLKDNNTSSGESKDMVIAYLEAMEEYEYPQETIELASDIICRKPRIGIDSKSVNKAAGYEVVTNFEPMLAYAISKAPKFNFTNRVFFQPKVDGVRCIATYDHGKVSLMSRNEKPIVGFSEIEKGIRDICTYNGVSYIVLDGEIVSEENFKDTMESLFTLGEGKTGVYNVFDVIKSLVIQDKLATFSTRLKYMYDLFLNADISTSVVMLETKEVYTYKGDLDLPKKIITQHEEYAKQGYEGLMIRLDEVYFYGRTNRLLKIKEMHTDDFRIVSLEEGSGRLRGTLGAIIVETDNDSYTSVGSGFSDTLRYEIWSNKDKYIGMIAEISYQEIIKESDKLRFPTFKSLRQDKN